MIVSSKNQKVKDIRRFLRCKGDRAVIVELDEIVDTLAEDNASAHDDEDTSALDQLFASL